MNQNKIKLPRGMRLEESAQGQPSIIIERKSRIVMKDGERIVKVAEALRPFYGKSEITFKTSAPVCSKTVKFLEEKGISVREI